jgi:hypothetical protein
MFVSMLGMLVRRGRVLFGLVVLTLRVVMGRLKMMMRRRVVMGSGLVMMLVCWMLLRHFRVLLQTYFFTTCPRSSPSL